MTNSPDDPFSQASDGSQPQMPQPEFPQAPQPEPSYYDQQQPGQPQYVQPQYAQPQYAYAGYGPNPGTAKNWMGITALVLSLASLITGFTAIGGIIFGHMSVAAAKRGEADNGGLGRAGLIIGYVFVALGILAVIGFFWFVGLLATECSGVNQADWCTA